MIPLFRIIIFCVAGILFAIRSWGIEFAPTSQFAEGRWVKVRTGDSGLYAISYSDLMEMGFPEPEKVGVYGKGGEMLSMNFDDGLSGHSYYDDIQPVSVIHEKGRLVFYAEGVDKVLWNTESGSFKRKSKNIYSDYGVYFLSDRSCPLLAEKIGESSEKCDVDKGWDYVLHERDLCHNVTNTGQQYWGEEFKDYGGVIKWSVSAPLVSDGSSTLEGEFYIEPSDSETRAYDINMSVVESDDKFSATGSVKKTEEFIPQKFTYRFNVKPYGEFNISMGVDAMESDFSRLDYWLLTYPKRMPEKEEDLAVPQRYTLSLPDNGLYGLELGEDISLVDITDPKRIKFASAGKGDMSRYRGFVASSSDHADIMLYSSESKLKNIINWKNVENVNLHGADVNLVELAIISVPRFYDYAIQIADLHKQYDGVGCIVVTPEELYNEFSGGVPDPTAYRAFLRMVYEKGGGRLKNVLLLGPSQADMRVMDGIGDMDCIIAFQEPVATIERDAASAYDFYGMLALNVNPDRLHREKMDLGVGLLSSLDEKDCSRAVRKIERYLKDSRFHAMMLNETLQIGGLHDVHAHDKQAIKFGELINTLSPAPMVSYNLSIDAFGNAEARNRFISELNVGKFMTVYFGHGSYMFMGSDPDFFTTSELSMLKNRHLGFAFLGGCDFSRPDKRQRGLGEGFVVDAENGMIGAVVSSRASHSIVNYEFAKRIAQSWLGRSYASASPTAGEFYAAAKSQSDYRNSLNYFYAGDPAVRFPVASRKISVTLDSDIAAGSRVRISGRILGYDGSTDRGYNGKAVLKFAKPARRIQSMDYVTHTYSNPSEHDTVFIDYKANHLLTFESDVKEGVFETDIVLPKEIEEYKGKSLPLYISAYDSQSHTGAIGYTEARVKSGSEGIERELERDTIAPVVELSYDYNSDNIKIACRDNAGLSVTTAPLSTRLDGEPIVFVNMESSPKNLCIKSTEYFYDAIGVESGVHKLEVEIMDIAGNLVQSVFEFTKPAEANIILLNVSSKAVVDELELTTDEDNLLLVVRDNDGRTVSEREISGTFRWDCTGCEGGKLPAGIYRLRVIEKGDSIHRRASLWHSVAIMD